ncbi:MAG: type II toxin-antitoxin system VapC family toxin [Pseudomonadota bacterium]
MVRTLFDTNILIDYLNGVEQAQAELARFSDKAISLVTWMEVMVGATTETAPAIRRFLFSLQTIPVDNAIGELAVSLRQQHKIKLPDAIIWATAQVQGLILVTRNTKDFSATEPGVHIPYLL